MKLNAISDDNDNTDPIKKANKKKNTPTEYTLQGDENNERGLCSLGTLQTHGNSLTMPMIQTAGNRNGVRSPEGSNHTATQTTATTTRTCKQRYRRFAQCANYESANNSKVCERHLQMHFGYNKL